MKQDVVIHTPFIRLDALMKLCCAAQSGGQAKAMVQGGEVLVNGAVCLMRGKKLVDGDTVQVTGQPDIYTVRVQNAV